MSAYVRAHPLPRPSTTTTTTALEIKRWRTLMQAKPPLACHANLVAEWGGVAPREGEGRGSRELGLGGGVRVGRGGGRRRRVHYVHPSATTYNSENHTGTRTLARLNWNVANYPVGQCLCLRNTQMHECVCVSLYMCA